MIVTKETVSKEMCQAEMTAVLAKYKMKLDPVVVMGSGGMSFLVNLTPVDAPPRNPLEVISNG